MSDRIKSSGGRRGEVRVVVYQRGKLERVRLGRYDGARVNVEVEVPQIFHT